MDMHFHWLHNCKCQQQFSIHLHPRKLNYTNYWTKHHLAKHHQHICHKFFTPHIVLEMFHLDQQHLQQQAAAVPKFSFIFTFLSFCVGVMILYCYSITLVLMYYGLEDSWNHKIL